MSACGSLRSLAGAVYRRLGVSATVPDTPALHEFEHALGAGRVITSEDELREWRDPFQFDTWDEYTASAVVMPETVEEVQAVVRIAGRHGVPLWTHSQGRNNGYGGPAPRVKGSVIVSLRNMNRVLEIDEECAYARRRAGRALVRPLRGDPGRRAPADAVDRRHRLGQRDRQRARQRRSPTCPTARTSRCSAAWRWCWPTATVMRTGMGALPGSRAWNVYKRGLGPTRGPALHAVQLRDRHEDGRLADALPRGLPPRVGAGVERRRPRAADGHAARADARRDDPRRSRRSSTRCCSAR